VALRMAEAWASCVARGRLQPTAARFEEPMAAVFTHPMTAAELARAQALPRLLPTELSVAVRCWAWEAAASRNNACLAH
jgi:hypothetical protein